MNSTKIILGLLAVGAVGVTVGLLLAPEKGEDTRKLLKGKLSDVTDAIAKLVESGGAIVESGREKLQAMRHEAENLKSDIKNETRKVANSSM